MTSIVVTSKSVLQNTFDTLVPTEEPSSCLFRLASTVVSNVASVAHLIVLAATHLIVLAANVNVAHATHSLVYAMYFSQESYFSED